MPPRSEEQFEEIRQKSREKIKKAAFELFALNSYHSTSISKIAEKTGVSKGLIYNYFDSKEKLLDELVTDGTKEIGTLVDLIEEKADPYEKLEIVIRATFDMIKSQKEYWRFYMSLIMQIDVLEAIREKISQVTEILIRKMEEVFTAIGVEDPKLESYKFGGMIDGICLHYAVFFEDDYPIDEVMESMINQYCKPKNKKHENT